MAKRPTYVIAEMSANHNGDFDRAVAIVRAMKDSGADAIKLQTYTADTLTIDCDRPDFVIGEGTVWKGQRLHDLYAKAYTPWEWHAELFALASELDMDCFSTPFDNIAVDFLETLDPPCYKIASFELVDLGLIEYVASKGRPIIMSTGMGSLEEISEAVAVVRAAGVPLTLLKCTSAYPSPPSSMNLKTMADMAERFGVEVGLSDHTLGTAVPVAAVALGARVVEKHFTLSRQDKGPDSTFSLEPHEFRQMVDAIRVAEQATGEVCYERSEKEKSSVVFRRSLYAVQDIAVGEVFTNENVRSIRPGHGLKPKFLPALIGKKATCSIQRGTAITAELIESWETSL